MFNPGLAGMIFALLFPVSVFAGSGIEVSGAWIRLMPPVAKNTAGYLSVSNNGEQAVCLVGASTTASRVTEIHEVFEKDGKKGMRPRKRITIGSGKTIELAPGGKHLMLIDLNSPLQEGQRVGIELHFQEHEPVTAEAVVRR